MKSYAIYVQTHDNKNERFIVNLYATKDLAMDALKVYEEKFNQHGDIYYIREVDMISKVSNTNLWYFS